MNAKRYTSLIRAGVLESLQFRAGTIVTFAGNIVYLIIIYYLWKAIYASSPTDAVNGMTFTDTMIYLVLAMAIFNFMNMYTVWEINWQIQTGSIILFLIKPLEYCTYMFFSCFGKVAVSFLTTFLPTFIIVYIITNGAVPLGVNLLFFLPALLMGSVINFCIDFFIGTVCLYTNSVWGVNIVKETVVLVLSGATIPLAFFPAALKTLASFLPFQAIYNIPLTLLINSGLAAQTRIEMLGAQFFWVIVTLAASGLFWQQASKAITVNGG